MKLYIIFTAFLAVGLAKDIGRKDVPEDLEAMASMELLRTDREAKAELLQTADSSYTAASSYSNNYVPPSQRPPRPWTQQNYVPTDQQNVWNQQSNYNNPSPNYPSINPTPAPANNYFPTVPQNNYYPPQNQQYQPTGTNYVNVPAVPANNPGIVGGSAVQNVPVVPPSNQQYRPTTPVVTRPTVPNNGNVYAPGQTFSSVPVVPANIPPANNPPAAQNPGVNPQTPQNDYYPQSTWASVIKNEQFVGENGNYKYEYQLSDGTWVGEEGYIEHPNTDYQNVIKKGWYTFYGRDGKQYTVSWYADNNGYYAYGDHLPKAPAAPPAVKAALEQTAGEEPQKHNQGYHSTTQASHNSRPTQANNYYPKPTQTPAYHQQQSYQPY